MLAALVGSSLARQHLTWPTQIRNTGMVVVGYTVGLSMTGAALRQMSQQLPSMVMLTAILLLFCAGIAAVVARLSGINYKTILLGSIPGGLSQMLVLAEETEDVNITVVTVIQVVRLNLLMPLS
jgi:membrane AbrB-like protein